MKSLNEAVKHIQQYDPLLAKEISCYQAFKQCLNATQQLWIENIQNIDGFSGHIIPGKKATGISSVDASMSVELEDEQPNNVQLADAMADVAQNYEEDLNLICKHLFVN